MTSASHSRAFNERLSRINDPSNTSYYDPESGMDIPKRVSRQRLAGKQKGRTGAASLLAALLLGAVAYLAASLGSFHVGLADQWFAEFTFLIATVGAILIGGLFKLNRLMHLAGKLVGAGALMAGLHNLVLLFPEQFTLLYSPQFVASVQASAKLGSAVILGQIYTF